MRRIATYFLTGFALFSFGSVQNARAADAVAIEPAYVTPGKPITLKWYFTGEKVLLSGGRFGKGVVVTGKTSMTDTPRTTTKYTFDVWYKIPAPKPVEAKPIDSKLAAPKSDPKTDAPKGTDLKVADPKSTDPKTAEPKATEPQSGETKAAEPKTSEPAPQQMVLQHVQYSTYAEVWSGVYPPMKAFHDSHGWQLSCLSNWKHDSVPTAEEGSDGLNYFQVEDDSVERVAVAIMPCHDQTADDVLKTVADDIPAHYQHAVLTDSVELTLNSVPAKMLTFTGLDMSHPGTKTASVVLVFVRKGRAYVLSARAGAMHFNSRLPILEKMLRSFTFNK